MPTSSIMAARLPLVSMERAMSSCQMLWPWSRSWETRAFIGGFLLGWHAMAAVCLPYGCCVGDERAKPSG